MHARPHPLVYVRARERVCERVNNNINCAMGPIPLRTGRLLINYHANINNSGEKEL